MPRPVPFDRTGIVSGIGYRRCQRCGKHKPNRGGKVNSLRRGFICADCVPLVKKRQG